MLVSDYKLPLHGWVANPWRLAPYLHRKGANNPVLPPLHQARMRDCCMPAVC